MEILKILKTLEQSSLDLIAEKIGCEFADAVSNAMTLLVSQGERIAELEEQHRWIPVTERLPEDDLPKDSKRKLIKVLVSYKTNGRWVVRTQSRQKGYWYQKPEEWDWVKTSDPITYWKPLPELPKEEIL